MINLKALAPRFDRTYLSIHQIPFDFSHLQYGYELKSPIGTGYLLLDIKGNLILSGSLYTEYEQQSFQFPDAIRPLIKKVYILDTRNQTTHTGIIGSAANFLAFLPNLTHVFITTNLDLGLATSVEGFLSNDPALISILGLHQLIDDSRVSVKNLLANDSSLQSLMVGSGVNLSGKRSINMFADCYQLNRLSFGTTELSRIDNQTGLDMYSWIPDGNHSHFGDDGHVQGVIINPLIDDSFINSNEIESTKLADSLVASSAEVVNDSDSANSIQLSESSSQFSSESNSSITSIEASQSISSILTSDTSSSSLVSDESNSDALATEPDLPTNSSSSVPNYFEQGYDSVMKSSVPDSVTDLYGDLQKEGQLIQSAATASMAMAASSNYSSMQADSSMGNSLNQLIQRKANELHSAVSGLEESPFTINVETHMAEHLSTVNNNLSMGSELTSQASDAVNAIVKNQQAMISLVNEQNASMTLANTNSNNAQHLESIAVNLTSMQSVASSIDTQMTDSANMVSSIASTQHQYMTTISSITDWFDDQLKTAKIQHSSASNVLASLADDAGEYNDMINSLALDCAPESKAIMSAQQEIMVGNGTIASEQSYVNSLASFMATQYADTDDSSTAAVISNLQLANDNLNQLTIDQSSVADSITTIQSHADSANGFVMAARVSASNQVNDIVKAAKEHEDPVANDISDALIDLLDDVQSSYDLLSSNAVQVGKFVKLNSANVVDASDLRSKADSYAQILESSLSDATSSETSASGNNQSTIASPASSQIDSNMAMAQSASNANQSKTQTDDSVGHPGQEYDDFDVKNKVLRDLWGVNKSITMKTVDGQLIELEPAKHPIFKLLDAEILLDAGFKFKIQYQTQIGFIKVDTSDIFPAYYWHGTAFQIAKTLPFKVRIKEMTMIHQQLNFKDKANPRLYLDDIVTVTGIEAYNGIPRFRLSDGTYITTNRYFVEVIAN